MDRRKILRGWLVNDLQRRVEWRRDSIDGIIRLTAGAACVGSGGGVGGAAGAATNTRTDSGVGSMPAIKGTTTSTASPMACARMESGTVYHFFVPTLMDGSTTLPKISLDMRHLRRERSPDAAPSHAAGFLLMNAGPVEARVSPRRSIARS
jgi:hypothetical protein